MIGIEFSRVEGLIKKFHVDIKKHVSTAKGKLTILRNRTACVSKRAYVQELLNIGDKVVTATPDEILTYAQQFDRLYTLYQDGNSEAENKADKAFKDDILKALGYSNLRSNFYPKYFRMLGIKCCVYCNSQLCVTVEDENSNLIAKFQVDHYVPKDNYPCFSIALYNLYPVCASCNNKKGVKKIDFALYSTGAHTKVCQSRFAIVDHDKTVAEYLIDRDPSKIKIQFTEPTPRKGYSSFDQLFAIKGIYDTQIDIIEDLILKTVIYDESYRSFLLDNFKELFPNRKTLDQIIIGNYLDITNIHKRPMAKFIQDISRDLKLI